MTNTEAYSESYETRAYRAHKVGDLVIVGPAYMSGGKYANDEASTEKPMKVMGRIDGFGNQADYKIGPVGASQWTFIVSPSRLVPCHG